MLNNKKIMFIIAGLITSILLFLLIIYAYGENEKTELYLAEVDEFIAIQDMKMGDDCHKDLIFNYIGSGLNQFDIELIGKVACFEQGYNKEDPVKAMYYVASACFNRAINWYDGDVKKMVCDGDDNYYQMNPEYLYLDTCNDYSFFDNYDLVMYIVSEAVKNPAPVYYWSVDDLHSDYATPYDIVGDNWFYSE